MACLFPYHSSDKTIVWQLTVRAEDNGIPVLSATAAVIVTVRRNLHAPAFNTFSRNVTVPANIAVDSVIIQVSATDDDGVGLVNGVMSTTVAATVSAVSYH